MPGQCARMAHCWSINQTVGPIPILVERLRDMISGPHQRPKMVLDSRTTFTQVARVMHVKTTLGPYNKYPLSLLYFVFFFLPLKAWPAPAANPLSPSSPFLSCPSRPQTLKDPHRQRLVLSPKTLAPIMAHFIPLNPSWTVRSPLAPTPQPSDLCRSPHRSLSLSEIPVWVLILLLLLVLFGGIRVFDLWNWWILLLLFDSWFSGRDLWVFLFELVFSVQNCNLLFMGMIDVESRVESVILVWSDTNLVWNWNCNTTL